MQRLLAPILLLLVCVGFYWKLALTGEYVWFDHPDMCYIEIPRLAFQARELHMRHFPLWNPNIWAGQSLIGQTQPGPLFPLGLLFLLLPLRDGYLRLEFVNHYYVFVHFLAAWFAWRACRDLGCGRVASGFAGCAFAFGGFVGTVAWWDVLNGALWTPLVFLYVFRAARGIRPWSSAAVAGAFLGVAWLSGHHEIPLLVSAATLLSWALLAWRNWRLLRLAALCFLVAGLVGAPQIWPTYEFGKLAKRWVGVHEPAGWNDQIPYTVHTIYSLPPGGLLATVLPGQRAYADATSYMGFTAFALAVLGLAACWRERHVRVLAVVGLLAGLYAMGAFTPLHGPLYALVPPLAKARIPMRAIHLWNFAIALLAAFGLDALLRGGGAAWPRRLAWILGAACAFTLGAALVFSLRHEAIDNGVLWAGMMAGVTAGALTALRAGRLRARACGLLLLAVMILEIYPVATQTYASRANPEQFHHVRQMTQYRDVADFLRAQPGPVRVAVNDQDVPSNFGDWHSIEMLQGYVAGLPENILRLPFHTRRVQELLGVTHAVGKQPFRQDQIPLYESPAGVKVFRNPGALPHAWSVHRAIETHTHFEFLTTLENPDIDLRRTAVMLGPAPRLETCAGEDSVRIVRHGTDRVTIEAEMACRGMVVLADTYYPGWRTRLDGRKVELEEAYGALRGVVVDGGSHTIDMIYRPLSILGGGSLCLAGLLLTFGLMARERQAGGASPPAPAADLPEHA